jgi:hypothetical protein
MQDLAGSHSGVAEDLSVMRLISVYKLLDPEDGGTMLHRNVSKHLPLDNP